MRQRVFLGLFLAVTAAVAAPTVFPTGVTIHDPAKVYPGDNLYVDWEAKLIRLVDMEGDPVRTWGPVSGAFPDLVAKMLPNGNVLAYYQRNGNRSLIERDWNGNVVWSFETPDAFWLHHDFERLPNGNTLVIGRRTRNSAPEIGPNPVADDWIVEVDPSGRPVWHWLTSAHYSELPLSEEARQAIYQANAGGKADIFHTNSVYSLPPNPHFATGDILVSQRDTNLVFVIERATGSIIWATQTTIGQHHATMTGSNILLFDNGGSSGYPPVSRSYSRVVEINPVTRVEEWVYDASSSALKPAAAFFGEFMGSAQRLPNGNTLITESTWGRSFEVTAGGEIVWEYLLPSRSLTFRMQRIP